MNIILYILSISLQISGALILVVDNIIISRDGVIKSIFGHKFLIENDKGDIPDFSDEYKERYYHSYINLFSFGYIALGYFFGIYGNSRNEYGICTIGILLLTVVLMGLAFCIANYLKNMITNPPKKEDLQRNGIETQISPVKDDEIRQLFENNDSTDKNK